MLKPIPLGEAGADQGRVPPHSYEAEQALIGAILLSNRAADRCRDFLRGGHFSEPLHGRIFDTMIAMLSQGRAADANTVFSAMATDPDLIEAGGHRYLGQLTGAATTVVNALDYAKLIYELHMRRELIALGGDMIAKAFNPGTINSVEIIDSVQDQISTITQHHAHAMERPPSGLRGPAAYLSAVVDLARMTEARRPGETAGISTGLVELDKKLGGLFPGDLITLAGATSAGKSSLATTIAYNIATKPRSDGPNLGVGIFSLEMTGTENWQRILGYRAGVSPLAMRIGPITQAELIRIESAAAEMRQSSLFVDDSPSPRVDEIERRAIGLRRKQRLDVMIVDYLQLMGNSDARNRRNENRTTEISDICHGLKNLAKELGIPLLLLAQLSRAVDAREDKRPQLSDLKETSALEQDSDVVLFIFREEYYLMRQITRKIGESNESFAERETRRLTRLSECEHIADLDIAKHRKGPIGSVQLHFDSWMTRFSDLARDGYEDMAMR